MTDLHITVGIPGCGKTTWANKWTRTNATIQSTDTIRVELTGDATSMEKNPEVFETLYARTLVALKAGIDVIVDATNLQAGHRGKLLFIADAVEAGAYAHRFVISEDFATCQARNLGRDRVVPEEVMIRFHKQFLKGCNAVQLEYEGWKVQDVKEK